MPPIHGFICYASKDVAEVERLEVHLKVPLAHANVQLWRDAEIASGARWDKEIELKIKQSRVFILALTPDFINSEFINTRELPLICTRHANGDCLILPAIIKTCGYKGFLSKLGLPLQVAPYHDKKREIIPATERAWFKENGYDVIRDSFTRSVSEKFPHSGPTALPAAILAEQQSSAGLMFESSKGNLSEVRGTIAYSRSDPDEIVARSSFVQQRHANTLLMVGQLKRQAEELDDATEWHIYLETVSRLHALLTEGPEVFARRLGEAWALFQSLMVSRERDSKNSSIVGANEPTLSTVYREFLDVTLDVLASLLNSFPTVLNKLVPELLALVGKVPIEVIERLVTRTIHDHIVDDETSAFLVRLMALGKGDGEAASKIIAFLQPTSRNLAFFIMSLSASTISVPEKQQSAPQRKAVKIAESERETILRVIGEKSSAQTSVRDIYKILYAEKRSNRGDVFDQIGRILTAEELADDKIIAQRYEVYKSRVLRFIPSDLNADMRNRVFARAVTKFAIYDPETVEDSKIDEAVCEAIDKFGNPAA